MALNTKKTILAIACKNEDVVGLEQLNLTIYMYSIGSSKDKKTQGTDFIRKKDLTIRVTHGLSGINPVLLPDLKSSKNVQPSDQAIRIGDQYFFDRYISALTFSKDDNYMSMVIKSS